MARFRAVVMIQPAGLGGRPVTGHRWRATTNASWTASSAMSISPKRRIRVATALPDSCRNTCSISERPDITTAAGSDLGLVMEGPDLDGGLAGNGRLLGPGQGRVQILGLDDPEAADLLTGLRERTVGGQDVAVLLAHDGGRRRLVQPTGEDPGPFLLHRLVEGIHVPERLLHRLLRRRLLPLHHVHREQVLLHRGLLGSTGTLPASRHLHERPAPRSTQRSGILPRAEGRPPRDHGNTRV